MRLVAIVELPSVGNADRPSALLQAAYQASRRGPVALLIPAGSESASAIERELDPLVAENRHVHGVTFAHASDPRVWSDATARTIVVASSAEARARASAIGACCLDDAAGISVLNGLSAEPPSRRFDTPPSIARESGRHSQLRAS